MEEATHNSTPAPLPSAELIEKELKSMRTVVPFISMQISLIILFIATAVQ